MAVAMIMTGGVSRTILHREKSLPWGGGGALDEYGMKMKA